MTDAPDSPSPRVVRVLTVCTGNICRSPYAEAMLGAGLEWARPGAFEVSSAGTHALVGRDIDPMSGALLAAHGLGEVVHSGRLLTGRLLAEQDLVLVMAPEHRQFILEEAPAAHLRTIGILDLAAALEEMAGTQPWQDRFAAVGADHVGARWTALPQLVAAHRSTRSGHVTQVPDPFRRGEAAFARMGALLDDAIRSIVLWERRFTA